MSNLESSQMTRGDLFSLPGRVVEAFARKALWDVGLNYGHGTGHGIGNFLCVHECKYHSPCPRVLCNASPAEKEYFTGMEITEMP